MTIMMTDPSCSPQSLWEKGIQVIFNMTFTFQFNFVGCTIYLLHSGPGYLHGENPSRHVANRLIHLPRQVIGAYRSGELV